MRFRGWLQLLAVLAIGIYQLTLSKVLRRWIACRFHPTCSEYGIMAVEKYGFVDGVRKTWARLRRCRPDNLETCIDYP